MFAMSRFTRLHALDETTTRLCGRNEVNGSLSFDDAADSTRFAELLNARFGDPDRDVDEEIDCSYAIGDRETGAVFEAYVGPSGPSYGAAPARCYEDPDADNLELRPEIMSALEAFDAWLESTPAQAQSLRA